MVNLEDALLYLGYDAADTADAVLSANVTRQMATARQMLLGAVGQDVETYLPEDPRMDELLLIYLDDLHTNRGRSAKEANALRRSVHDMEQQLRVELARAKEAAGL